MAYLAPSLSLPPLRQFARLCGAGRFVYNELLADQIREYGRFEAGEIERPGASEFDFGKRYTRLKAKEGNEVVGHRRPGYGCLSLGGGVRAFFPAVAEWQVREAGRVPPFQGPGQKPGVVHDPGGCEDSEKAALGAEGRLDPDEPQGIVAHARN